MALTTAISTTATTTSTATHAPSNAPIPLVTHATRNATRHATAHAAHTGRMQQQAMQPSMAQGMQGMQQGMQSPMQQGMHQGLANFSGQQGLASVGPQQNRANMAVPALLQQLLYTLKAPTSPQQQAKVLSILKQHPQLMTDFIKQRQEQWRQQEQQQQQQQEQLQGMSPVMQQPMQQGMPQGMQQQTIQPNMQQNMHHMQAGMQQQAVQLSMAQGMQGMQQGMENPMQQGMHQAMDIIHELHQMKCDPDQSNKKTDLSEDLQKIAAGNGFIISGNPASGNCMFYALSEQLKSVKGIQISHRELRVNLVKFLAQYPSLPDGTDLFNFVDGYPSWVDYLESMERDGTWGDHVILWAAANCYEARIRVISSLDHEISITPDHLTVNNTKPLVLGHIHEKHYVSLHPRQDFNASNYSESSIPTIIFARGPKALAAYERALKFGKTYDKRVKVLVIGRDRAGKTSLVKSLKGEPFNKKETSTEGVEMSSPIKNAGTQAWKNVASQQHTTAFDHKCAELIANEVKDKSAEQRPSAEANEKQIQELVINANEDSANERNSKEAEQVTASFAEDIPGKTNVQLPDPIAALVEEYSEVEGIWPVIWDFAGQAVYRAIHPIFMSPEAIYLLVIDLTKKLSDTADCFVNQGDHGEEKVESPENEDTNLDHILRWMSLVDSVKLSVENTVSSSEMPSTKKPKPPRSVILVGTKADLVEGDPKNKMDLLLPNIFRNCPKGFLKHIAEERFAIDNTRAGKLSDQELQQIVDLRDKIIELANEMPHTKHEIPLQWLSVEQEIVSQNEPYVSKTKFRQEIAEKCTLKEDDDLEELLHFLHNRGTIIYHDRPENKDGLVVLDPKWLMRTICAIITANPKWRYPPELQSHFDNLESSGKLSKELLDLACVKLNIGDIRDSLIFIMKKFNLIFEWQVANDSLIYLVPCMLTKHKDVDYDTSSSPPPLCLMFDEGGYVPCGLFSRLVVLFGVWASKRCTAVQPDLSSNVASFFVGEKYTLHLVCCSSVIKLYLSIDDASDEMKINLYCVNILRQLETSWKKLKTECHWLHSVRLSLCARCESCPSAGSGRTPCVRHSKQKCSHDDCAHYLDLRKSPLVCNKRPFQRDESLKEKYNPWIEALKAMKSEEMRAKNTIRVLQKMHCDAADNIHKKTSLSDDLMKIFSDKGFMVCENQASGNCMFYALSEQLEHVNGIEVSHQELRETLVQFLRETPNLPDGTDLFSFVIGYPTWSDYLTDMAKGGTWGDHLILRAAANCYETRIRIINSLGQEVVIYPDHLVLNTKSLVLGHIHEMHYVSLVPRQGLSDEDQCVLAKPKRPLSPASITQPFKRLKLMPGHLEGTSDKDHCLKRKKKSPSSSSPRASVVPGNSKACAKDQCSSAKRKRKSPSGSNGKTPKDISMTPKPTGVKDGTPEDEVLERLARKIPDLWKTLGRRLKIDEPDLIAIHKQNEECCEKAYNMLLRWKRANASKATFIVLYNALCHDLVDRKDLAEKFCCGGHC